MPWLTDIYQECIFLLLRETHRNHTVSTLHVERYAMLGLSLGEHT